MRFQNKIVVVTGGGRGIGRGIARAFAAEGAQVVVNDINPDSAQQTVDDIIAGGGQARVALADVASKMAVQTFMYEVLEDSSWGRIDILINNAGVQPTGSILKLDEFDWDRTLNVNLKGAFLCLQTAARAMLAQGDGGAIVNIGAIAESAVGLYNRAAYVASKNGIIGLTRETARELAAYNIRVNAVCPGVIATPMTKQLCDNPDQMVCWQREIPQGHVGNVDDVTGLVLFLCTDAAGYITGQAINVDGGKVMR